MNLHANASIAYVVISLAGAFGPVNRPGQLAAGVLTRLPGTGALSTSRAIGEALGMEVLEIRLGQIEYHPGALDLGAYEPVEKAIASNKPVLIILDEADCAQPGVLPAVMTAIAMRAGNQPCAVLATVGEGADKEVARQMADGLGREVSSIIMRRTDAELQTLFAKA